MDSLSLHNTKRNVYSYFAINFRDKGLTYLLSPKDTAKILETRKSIPIEYCRKNGILVPQFKKIKRY